MHGLQWMRALHLWWGLCIFACVNFSHSGSDRRLLELNACCSRFTTMSWKDFVSLVSFLKVKERAKVSCRQFPSCLLSFFNEHIVDVAVIVLSLFYLYNFQCIVGVFVSHRQELFRVRNPDDFVHLHTCINEDKLESREHARSWSEDSSMPKLRVLLWLM